MAAPKEDNGSKFCPFYADLNKKANAVFTKGFHFGFIRLDLKTKSEAGVQFVTGLSKSNGKILGSLASKYTIPEYNLSITEKWNTDNILGTDMTFTNIRETGLNVTLEGTLAAQTGTRGARLKTSLAQKLLAFNTNTDLQLAGPIVDAALVVGKGGWYGGILTQLDSQQVKVTKANVSLSYQTNDFVFTTNIDNGKEFGGSIYQKVKENIECGIAVKWLPNSSDTMFGVGVGYQVDKDISLHAKINNKALFGFGHRQILRPGISMTLSLAIDGQSWDSGDHKVGFALELEP